MTQVIWNRRRFLGAVAAGTLSANFLTAKEDPDVEQGWIDAHSHIWTRDLKSYPLAGGQTVDDLKPPSFTTEELLQVASQNGVSRVVLIQHKPYHGLDNSYITDSIAKYPGRFSAVACVDAQADHPDRAMKTLALKGARGFRIRPHDTGARRWSESSGMKIMWKYAAQTGLVICPLLNPEHLPELDTMCRMFPKTDVVIDHFARIGMDGTIRESDLKRLEGLSKYPHVRVKISAFYALGKKQPPYDDLIPMIRRLLTAYGSKRLLWATDSPYQLVGEHSYAASIALIRDRIDGLSQTDKNNLLRKTAEQVYFRSVNV